MAKTKLIPAEPVGPTFVDATPVVLAEQEIRVRQAIDQQETTVRAVAAQLGYQLPADCTDPDLIQRDIAINMRRSVEACLEVGRGLRVLKEACDHGQFTARLEVLGIDKYVASRFMQSAMKFSKLPSNATLTKAIGNQTKLFEMLVLDDEQIEELELTGQTGELKLDDVASMSVKELRKALREARDTLEARSRVLSDKEQTIERLNKKALLVSRLSPEDMGSTIRKETTDLVTLAQQSIRAVRPGLEKLTQHFIEHDIHHGEFMAGLLSQLQLALNQLRSEFGIKAAPDGEEMPDWLRTSIEPSTVTAEA